MNYISGVNKFLSRRLNFQARNYTLAPDRGRKKMGDQNKIVLPIKTQLEALLFIVLHYPNRTCSFHFKCVSIKSLLNEAFGA